MNDIVQQLKLILGVEGQAKSEAQVNSFNKSIGGLVKAAAGLAATFIGVQKAVKLAGQSMKEYERSVQAIRQVQATLNATGNAANFTAGKLSNMASALQKVSNFGDEDILQGATMSLLRYDGISKEMFPRVQAMAVDLGEAMGGLENASRTLGISLADPMLGMTRLRRAGVMFTESQQELIKSLVEAGKKTEAQEVLLAGLEGKYKGLATASISATQQMKNAWGDYLEVLGSSLHFIDGIKKGFTMALYDIAASSNFASKEAQTQALRVQEKWGIATIYITNFAKALFNAVGSAVMGAGTALATLFNTLITGSSLAGAAIRSAILNTAEFAIKYDPFRILLISYNEAIKRITGKDLKLTGLHDALLKEVQGFDRNFNEAWERFKAGLKESGGVWKAWFDVSFNIPSNTKEAIARQIEQLKGLIQTQIAGLDVKMPDLTGLDEESLQNVGEAVKSEIDNRLKAYAMYYETVDKYGQQWYDSQLALYKHDLETNYSTILTKEQLEALYLAKAKELTDEQFKHFKDTENKKQAELNASLDKQIADHIAFMDKWKATMDTQRDMELSFTKDRQRWIDLRIEKLNEEVEAYRQQGVDIVVLQRWRVEQEKQIMSEIPESMQTINDQMDKIGKAIEDGAIHSLSNSMYDLVTGAKNLEEAWKATWKGILEATLRAITQMIAKMLVLKAVQLLLGGGGGVAPMLPTGASDLPPTPTITSAGSTRPSGIGMGYGGTTGSQILNVLMDMKDELRKDKEQSFNLYMDGMPLRNALKRVEHRVNALGGANV